MKSKPINLQIDDAEFGVILYALKRLEQDESEQAGSMVKEAAALMDNWFFQLLGDDEEE